MNGFVLFWGCVALCVFWAVGAYNRLVRLRAQTSLAFAAVNEHFTKYVVLVRANASSAADDSLSLAWRGVESAATQFEVSLASVNQRPLDAAAMGAMNAAYAALCASWARLQEEPPDLAGERMPEALQQNWAQLAAVMTPVINDFNRLVTAYNQAISQFPANLLARLFGFRAAATV
jgi:LemA protein